MESNYLRITILETIRNNLMVLRLERQREMKRKYIQKRVKYKKQIYDYRTLLRSEKSVEKDRKFAIQLIYSKGPIHS